jgi:hypothetical protein
MAELTVISPNTLFDASGAGAEARFAIRRRSEQSRSGADAEMSNQVLQIRRRIDETACSSTWAEDWLYRGVDYAPDFECKCEVCRTLFPNRLHPRPVRETDYSTDCQDETSEDPEFAEELAKLRNDRPRYGSIFVSGGTKSVGHSRSRTMRSFGGNA